MGNPDMTVDGPLLSIGLPVFNGERYLCKALDSLLTQSLSDFELIISDNASTDGTEAICRRYAASEPRIRYHRQSVNIGAGRNYNFVFRKSCGRYFKWAAHDDYQDATCLQACINVLETCPDVVLCHGMLVDIDEAGTILTVHDRGKRGLAEPVERFWQMVNQGHNCAEIFGVIRREVLAKSQLIRDYTDSDRTLLAQLALAGRIYQEPTVRFYRRVHPMKSDKAYTSFNDRAVWFNPDNRNRIVLSASNQFRDLLVAIIRSELTFRDKTRCMYYLAKAAKWNFGMYRQEFAWVIQRLFHKV